MLHVNGVVVGLRKTAGDRLGDSKKAIQNVGTEKWVVNEVVTNAVDVRIHHQRIDKSQNQHHPERRVRVQKEQSYKIGEMEKAGQSGHRIPAGVRE